MARLVHPNIVQIHEVSEADGHPYCELEFVEGGSLAEDLDGQPLPPRKAAKLVETLARAMLLAHSRNVVHRDLNPSNVLLTAEGTPKITDFGLARQMDSDNSETLAGVVMGTPSYMAPEQAAGQSHDAGLHAHQRGVNLVLGRLVRRPAGGIDRIETGPVQHLPITVLEAGHFPRGYQHVFYAKFPVSGCSFVGWKYMNFPSVVPTGERERQTQTFDSGTYPPTLRRNHRQPPESSSRSGIIRDMQS